MKLSRIFVLNLCLILNSLEAHAVSPDVLKAIQRVKYSISHIEKVIVSTLIPEKDFSFDNASTFLEKISPSKREARGGFLSLFYPNKEKLEAQSEIQRLLDQTVEHFDTHALQNLISGLKHPYSNAFLFEGTRGLSSDMFKSVDPDAMLNVFRKSSGDAKYTIALSIVSRFYVQECFDYLVQVHGWTKKDFDYFYEAFEKGGEISFLTSTGEALEKLKKELQNLELEIH